jgi:hypothetical protein
MKMRNSQSEITLVSVLVFSQDQAKVYKYIAKDETIMYNLCACAFKKSNKSVYTCTSVDFVREKNHPKTKLNETEKNKIKVANLLHRFMSTHEKPQHL